MSSILTGAIVMIVLSIPVTIVLTGVMYGYRMFMEDMHVTNK